MNYILSSFALVFLLLTNCCAVANNREVKQNDYNQEVLEKDAGNIGYQSLGQVKDGKIIVTKDVDLNNSLCELPKDFLLEFHGAKICNGILVGNSNRLSCKGVAFDNVTIRGIWDVPTISTSLFETLESENSIKNVFALANPSIHNKILIEKGNYYVNASKDWESCIKLCSNTEVIINGNIILVPNSLIGCYVIGVCGEDISIRGRGSVIGDRLNHKGEKGEWGMGINIEGSNHVKIQNITIKDCWGDCIYIGGKSKKVFINKAIICNGRRQGISITSADGVTITNCFITDIQGTDPECAIDAEPNEKDTVNNVLIQNVRISNCKGGILAYGKASKCALSNIVIRNNKISTTGKSALGVIGAGSVKVEKNHLMQTVGSKVVTLRDIMSGEINNNYFQCYKDQKDSDDSLFKSSGCKKMKSRNNKEKTL